MDILCVVNIDYSHFFHTVKLSERSVTGNKSGDELVVCNVEFVKFRNIEFACEYCFVDVAETLSCKANEYIRDAADKRNGHQNQTGYLRDGNRVDTESFEKPLPRKYQKK